ncbi:MAG TPA: tyrosine--tRNA ligase [Acidimicrobiales bacterium]|nr:tyrosine--tRNA ligase [Acidimicrobiales bacterium]
MTQLSEELQWRGLVHQVTDPDLLARLDDGAHPVTAYIGFDPTADSLHVGNLLQLCNLRRLQEAGHRPIALAGGGTGMIGDPGGKSEERNLLTMEQLGHNLEGIRSQLEQFLDFSGGDHSALLVNNGDWLWHAGLLEFLRDVGKHFTVNQMVAKESVRARFEGREQGISYTEFSYMLLQAYDFLQLFDAHGCNLQLGGSDQWGNITMGVELIRKVRGEAAYGLTSPLVLKADGTKFGKSETGTVWLSAERTSPYRFFQFFINTEDAVVGQYLRYFTWLSREEIEALDKETAEHPERRAAQRALARSVTALVHGQAEAERAEQAAAALFTGDVNQLDERTLLEVFADAPSLDVPREPLPLTSALVGTGLASSKSDARRAIEQGSVSVNGEKQPAERDLDPAGDSLHGRYAVLRKGKKSFAVVRWE